VGFFNGAMAIERKKGIAIPPADATIAAIAVSNGISLFTNDEHFKIIAGHSILKLYP